MGFNSAFKGSKLPAGLYVANVHSGRFGCEDICLLERDTIWEAEASPETSVSAYHTTRRKPYSVNNFDSCLPDVPVRGTGRSLTYVAGTEKLKLKPPLCCNCVYIYIYIYMGVCVCVILNILGYFLIFNYWRDNVYSFVLMGVHHSSTWRHRGTSSYRLWRNRRLLP